jgi:hypothetical protein
MYRAAFATAEFDMSKIENVHDVYQPGHGRRVLVVSVQIELTEIIVAFFQKLVQFSEPSFFCEQRIIRRSVFIVCKFSLAFEEAGLKSIAVVGCEVILDDVLQFEINIRESLEYSCRFMLSSGRQRTPSLLFFCAWN